MTKESVDVALVVREWSILALSDAHVVQLKKYGEVACGWSTIDGPFKPVLEEIRNEPAMIEVGMSENHSVQFGQPNLRDFKVRKSPILGRDIYTAVNHDSAFRGLKQKRGAPNLARPP